MLAYATNRRILDRRPRPSALLVIVGAHALLLAAVMTARMDLPGKIVPTITEVDLIDAPKPPPPDQPPPPQPQPQPRDSVIDQMPRIVPIPQPDKPQLDQTPIPLPPPLPNDTIGNRIDPLPVKPTPPAEPVRVAPRFATPADLVRPPYPDEKRRLEQEAVLRLRLSIDERGRVVAVEPVGAADPAFLAAARKHLTAFWRYKPATEDGRPVPAFTVITLRFELEE
jgi:protein TonB